MTFEEFRSSLLPCWVAARFSQKELPLKYPAKGDEVSALIEAFLENTAGELPHDWSAWATFHEHLDALQVHRGGLQRIFSRDRDEKGNLGPGDANSVKDFYAPRTFFKKTTAFASATATSSLLQRWMVAGTLDFDATMGSKLREDSRFTALAYVPKEPLRFPGVLFNGYGGEDGEMWIGFRDPRDLPRSLNQLSPEERLEILRSKPGKRPALVPFPDIARLSWMRTTLEDLRLRFANDAETFNAFVRKLVQAVTAALPAGDVDLLDDGTHFGIPGPITFVNLPWMETLTADSALQRLPTENELHDGTTVICTNHNSEDMAVALIGTTLDRSLSICGVKQLLDRLSYHPEVWSEFLGNQHSVRFALGSDTPRLRSLVARRDPGVLRTLPDMHAVVERSKLRPGAGIRLTGRHGSGKSTAALQLVKRDLAETLVAILDPALLIPGDLDALREMLNQIAGNFSGVTLVCDDIDTLTDELRTMFLRTAHALHARHEHVSVIITYNALSAEGIAETSTFVALQMPEELLDAAPSTFRDRLLWRYCRALDIHLTSNAFDELQRAVNRAGNTPRAVVDLVLDAKERSLAQALRAATPTTEFWKDQYRTLDARKEASADLLQVIGFLKFADMLTPGEPLVEHFFRGYFGRSAADWRAGLDALSDAGVITVSDGRIYSDVPVFADLPELRTETITHFRGLLDWLLSDSHELEIWDVILTKFGLGFMERGHWAEALRVGEVLTEHFPDDFMGYQLKSRGLAGTGRPDAAMDIVTEITRARPDWNELWFALSWTLLSTGAKDEFYKVMDKYLRRFITARQRGSTGGGRMPVNTVMERLEDLEIIADQVFRHLPDDPAFLWQLYNMSLQADEFEKAFQYINRIIGFYFRSGWPLSGLLQPDIRPLFTICKQTPAATLAFGDAALVAPTQTALRAATFVEGQGDGCIAHLIRGVIYHRERDFVRSATELSAVLARHPELNRTFTRIHSRTLEAITNDPHSTPEAAVALVKSVLSTAGMEKEDLFRYALGLLYSGDLDGAEEQLRIIGDWPEHDVELKRRLGYIRFHQKRYEEAIELESSVLERMPFDVEALTIRSNAYRWKGDLVAAEEDLRRAMQLDDADRMLDGIVINLVRIGKARDAIRFWHDLRRTKPSAGINANGVAALREELASLPRAERLAIERLVA